MDDPSIRVRGGRPEAKSPLPWFALKVSARSERLASKALRYSGYEVFSPTYSERRRYSDRFKIVDAPVLPGYVLIRWNRVDKVSILRCPGVKNFVCFGGKPEAISEATVADVRRVLENGGRPVRCLERGDRVRVETGVLSGIEGIYLRGAGAGQIVISIDIIDRSVALHVDEDQVQSLQTACA